MTSTNETNYFGRKVSVLFDDGKRYIGIITGKDQKRNVWVTRFEDGTEDTTPDPNLDKDWTERTDTIIIIIIEPISKQ